MFFIFHILVFTLYFGDVSTIVRRDNAPNFRDLFEENDFNDPGDVQQNKPIQNEFIYRNPMFRTEKNITSMHSNNLKSNVFEKVLSDEMYAMKQHFFEEEVATTTFRTKTGIVDSSIKVEQKWSTEDITKSLAKDPTDNDKKQDNQKKEQKIDATYKSLDVRSLDGNPHNGIKCSCSNANHQCKHGDDCTRKPHSFPNVPVMVPPIPPPILPPPVYMPYQAYLLNDNSPSYQSTQRARQHHKRRKTTCFDDDEDFTRKPRCKHKYDGGGVVVNFDYNVEYKDEKPPACTHEELNTLYSTVGKGNRKCYCSSSQAIRTHNLIDICMLLLVVKLF